MRLGPLFMIAILAMTVFTMFVLVQVTEDMFLSEKRSTKEPISIDDAKIAVRNFIERPGAKVTYDGDLKVPHGSSYRMGSDEGTFYVNMYSGVVESAVFYDRGTVAGTDDIGIERALSVAREYALRKYPGFNESDMELKSPELLDHGSGGKEYSFTWNMIENGVTLPSYLHISVDQRTGEVKSYTGIKRPVLVSLTSSVTRDEAIDTAKEQFSGSDIGSASAELRVIYTMDGEQMMVWLVTVEGTDKDTGIVRGGQVVIDATSGEAVSKNPYM